MPRAVAAGRAAGGRRRGRRRGSSGSPRSPARPPAPRCGWVAATLTARGLAAELQESTGGCRSLVGAVKTYAYMDRGELVEVDLHEGLETTLAVLGHKLKHTAIEVVRDYDRDAAAS